MRNFEGRVVVVTGSSRGIGQAMVVAFSEAGATVVGLARSQQDETSNAAGESFHAVAYDSNEAGNAGAVTEQIISRFGRIDVLINNAGTIRRADAVEFSAADWDEVIRVNLSAPFFLAQAAAKWWIMTGRAAAAAQDRLRIINIASLLSFQGGIRVVSYAAAKHGLAGVTKALANEWARERINVNAIAPGYIATDNTRPLREDPVRGKAILERIPQNNWGGPADVAGSALWLASKDADYVNGAIINIDGGWLGR